MIQHACCIWWVPRNENGAACFEELYARQRRNVSLLIMLEVTVRGSAALAFAICRHLHRVEEGPSSLGLSQSDKLCMQFFTPKVKLTKDSPSFNARDRFALEFLTSNICMVNVNHRYFTVHYAQLRSWRSWRTSNMNSMSF